MIYKQIRFYKKAANSAETASWISTEENQLEESFVAVSLIKLRNNALPPSPSRSENTGLKILVSSRDEIRAGALFYSEYRRLTKSAHVARQEP